MRTKKESQAILDSLVDFRSKAMERAGYRDCKEGIQHTTDYGDDYDRGYNKRYQEEQIAGAK
jgi:hypothetical protein